MHTVNQPCPCRSFNFYAGVSGNSSESSKKAFQCLPPLRVHMANASEITELFLSPLCLEFSVGALQGFWKLWENKGKAESRERRKESAWEDKNRRAPIKRRAHHAHLGTRHTSHSASGNEHGEGMCQMVEVIRLPAQLKFLRDRSDAYRFTFILLRGHPSGMLLKMKKLGILRTFDFFFLNGTL